MCVQLKVSVERVRQYEGTAMRKLKLRQKQQGSSLGEYNAAAGGFGGAAGSLEVASRQSRGTRKSG